MELLTVDTVCDYVTRQSMAVAVARVQMFDHQDWQSVDQKDLRSSSLRPQLITLPDVRAALGEPKIWFSEDSFGTNGRHIL